MWPKTQHNHKPITVKDKATRGACSLKLYWISITRPNRGSIQEVFKPAEHKCEFHQIP